MESEACHKSESDSKKLDVDQQPVERTNTSEESQNESNGKKIKWGHVFDWGFWTGHSLAVFAMFLGGIFLAAITNFPGGNPKTLWWFALGVWILSGAFIWWITAGIVARMEGRDLLTSKEIEERESAYKEKIQSRLDTLETGIGKAQSRIEEIQPRTLSQEARQAITDAISAYPGQLVVIQCHHWNFEAMRYAQEFADLFNAAGWQCGPIENIIVSFDFYNLQLGVGESSKEAEAVKPPHTVPDGFMPLYKVLVRLGLIDDNGKYQRYLNRDPRMVFLSVGAHPGKIRSKPKLGK
jgi:hypothetical protein